MTASNREMLQPTPTWVEVAANVIRRLPAGRYQVMNHLSRRLPATFVTRMPKGVGGLLFECNLQDAIAREVCFTGCYEPQETAMCKAILRPGMTFVDVGANWGYFTLLGTHLVGSHGRVVSLEPDPRLFRILKQNIAVNNLVNVDAQQIAAADIEGKLTLAGHDESSENWGVSKLVEHPTANTKTFDVVTTRLDDVMDDCGISTVDLLKMDIEGAEELALKGMSLGLARHHYQRLLLEVHPSLLAERGRTVQDALELLIHHGYKGWWIDFSPAATRRAAYANSIKLKDYLRPITDFDGVPDAWAHTLWLAPGIELPISIL